ncbi:MAG TPA: AAA family ATPase [Gaiellaceae bacterium]|nr:AAA family ATPase [Gaiellaceae bacterium]
MPAGPPEIVGRDPELELVSDFLSTSPARALVLEGGPGIGKTALWVAATDVAEARGSRVLRARPAELERALGFATLRDLVECVPDDDWNALPAVQAQALGAAVARLEATTPPAAGLLEAAVLSLFRAAARSKPLLVAIDDLQWVDEPSASVVVYALRRLGDFDARLLATCRAEPGSTLPFGLRQALDERRLLRHPLESLSEGAIRRLLHSRLGVNLPRTALHTLHEACGGNPLYALELAKAQADGARGLPPGLRELLEAQLRPLAPETRETLLVIAAALAPTVELLRGARAAGGLEEATARKLVSIDRGRIRFSHPLLATAAWECATDERRREVHRRLAEVVDDPEQRALHVALGAVPPDRAVADLLDGGSASALKKGAPAAAADLLELARQFDPGRPLAARLAAAHAAAGHWDRVSELVNEALERLLPGLERAQVLVTAAELRPSLDALLEQAIVEAGDSPVGIRARVGLAVQRGLGGRWAEAVADAQAAAQRARLLGDDALLGVALTFAGGLKLLDSRPDGVAELAEALALEDRLGGLPTTTYESPRMWLAIAAQWADDPRRARGPLAELRAEAEQHGDEMSAFQLQVGLLRVELQTGDLARARQLGAAALDQVELIDYAFGRIILQSALAALAAREGDHDRARRLGTDAAAALGSAGDRLWSTFAEAALLLTELAAGNPQVALSHAEAIAARFPDRECWWSYHQGDELEALVLAGHRDRAWERVVALRRAGRELRLPRFLAWSARGEGLLDAATGDLAAADAALTAARAQHERFDLPLERARTLLAHGHVLRRLSRRHDARETLEDAAAVFDRAGAQGFAEAARNELAHVGGRAAAGPHELTGAEARIARLVSDGRSNKDVAAELFVTVATVEATLTRVYRKLGVRSRTQLARTLGP